MGDCWYCSDDNNRFASLFYGKDGDIEKAKAKANGWYQWNGLPSWKGQQRELRAMTRQDQIVGSGGEAHQAGRDIIINQGLTIDQMSEIMRALARQAEAYFSEAESKAEARMNELRDALLGEFVEPNASGNKEAFADPDYQFLLRDAQHTYARSGEETLRDELVRLLVQRSREPTENRTAKILNQAVTLSGRLTKQEFSALCAVFVLKYIRLAPASLDTLKMEIQQFYSAFLHDLSNDVNAYEYLESLGLVSINRSMTFNLDDFIQMSFGRALSSGFSLEQLATTVIDASIVAKLWPHLEPAPAFLPENLQFSLENAASLEVLLNELQIVDPILRGEILILYSASLAQLSNTFELFNSAVPNIAHLRACWSSTLLQGVSLTAIGKAMAHSVLTSRSPLFTAPLKVWVA